MELDQLGHIRLCNLRAFMQREALTTKELCELINKTVGYQSLRNYLTEKLPMSNSAALKLTEALDLEVGWFDQDRGGQLPKEEPPHVHHQEVAVIAPTMIQVTMGTTKIETEVSKEIAQRILSLIVLGE